MKGIEELIGIFIVAIFAMAILSTVVSQINLSKQCEQDLEALRGKYKIMEENNTELQNQISDLEKQLENCIRERDTCKINLSECENNLTCVINENQECVENLNRLQMRANYIYISLGLASILSILTILKQLQMIPERREKKNKFWLILSVGIILFALLGLFT